MKDERKNGEKFYWPFAFSTVFCLLVASCESLEITAPDNVFRCLNLVGAPTSNHCKRRKMSPKPKDHTKSKR